METGIITYISASLNAKRLEHLEQYIESIWQEINIKNTTPILVGIIYRNPDERVEWADRFCNMIDAVILEAKDFFMLGDFNIDLLKPNACTTWTDKVSMCDLIQLVKTPT